MEPNRSGKEKVHYRNMWGWRRAEGALHMAAGFRLIKPVFKTRHRKSNQFTALADTVVSRHFSDTATCTQTLG